MNKRIRRKKGLSKIRNDELWDLDYTIIKFILPRLQKFKQININSYPNSFKSIEEWHNVIDKIIWSFQFAKDVVDCNYSDEYRTKQINWDRYKNGMNLFRDYFMDLWD